MNFLATELLMNIVFAEDTSKYVDYTWKVIGN